MAPSLHTPLLTFITLVSTTLLAISIATLGLTAHYTHGIGSAGGSYIWYGAVDSPERAQYWKEFDAGNVTQERFHFAYDGENERWISASAALGLLAGLAGLVMCGWSWWNKKQVTASWKSSLPAISLTLLTTAVSILSIYFTSHKQAVLAGSTCIPHSVPNSAYNNLVCTRELAACNLLESIVMSAGDEFNQQMCGEARASRKMLVALVVVSVVCVVFGLAQMLVGRKEGSVVADMRVEKLRQDEYYEESKVYESVRGVGRA